LGSEVRDGREVVLQVLSDDKPPTPDPLAVLRGRFGGHASWANTLDRSARTAPARAALEAKFLAEADGDPVRAESFRKAYYAKLALKSAQARRKPRLLKTTPADAVEPELSEAGGPDAAA
jgi:hypothetical protein